MVRWLLRLEGLTLGALSVYGFFHTGGGWWWFAVLVLVPDLSLLAYLVSPRSGSVIYNLAHTLVGPAALALVWWVSGSPVLLSATFLWAAHIGVDRFLGLGLKYPARFNDTHLQRV